MVHNEVQIQLPFSVVLFTPDYSSKSGSLETKLHRVQNFYLQCYLSFWPLKKHLAGKQFAT